MTEKPTVRSIVEANSSLFRSDFPEWLAANKLIFRRFVKEADLIWAKGRQHYSARTIGEYLRHETALREQGTTYKLNDHVWPDLARLYLLIRPGREEFFSLRSNEKRTA
jgi:hypothetical protein